ncbi:molybdate ABC transporter substrate-binding protein [Xylophilus sp.]|uniref:molybdate ABC transporter substrate-binding protein n=1 Tax=Xylophilus sp. TaxID=2653893 RepID=UPI0013B687A1|nr:molybdate ABC transporter substrate-binding protein [Xylophilus sp.]KAF1047978.1 MAG: Molybdate-binding protein ModA [Xylophilus sp.]
MRLSRLLSRLLSTLVVALALPLAAAAQQLTVSAAASLTDAFKELGPKFEAAHPGATLRFNFAASGALLQQISQGAPVDVFASADQETLDRAVAQKLVDPATRRNFVTNSLVLIEPAQGGAGVKSLADLRGPAVRKIAVGKTATVPVGRYTQQVLDGAGLWGPLEPKFVQADSVRQVLDYVSRGEAEAGFVYATDAAIARDKVHVVLTASGHTPVSYPVAVVADSKQPKLAADFVGFLTGEPAQQILGKYGFGKP